MITVYFDDVDFSKKSFRGRSGDIVVIGNREILSIRDYTDNVIAQFDMNAVVGWCDDGYEYTDEEGDTE